MSGLFGALAGPVPLAPELGARMASALADIPAGVTGRFESAEVLLGAHAAWHGPKARAPKQPYVHPERGLVVVFDGRLDREAELAARLGVGAGVGSWAELVALSYLGLGPECVATLQGDFAFALWDPEARRLLLGRDVLGVRPLYFARVAGTFLFASQPRALFAQSGFARELDELRLAQYLSLSFPDTERSFFRGVTRLPPAHFLSVSSGEEPKLTRYFRFDPHTQLAARPSAEYAEQFRALFQDAVRERAHDVEGLGCLLSGGLDSSGLYATLLGSTAEPRFSTYSARFPDFPDVDEGDWLALLPKAYGVTHAEYRADAASPLDEIDALHRATDEPFHAPNLFIYQGLAQLAQSRGTRVLLDGLDGDTVVDHGYGYLRELFFAGKPRRLLRAMRALHGRMGFSYTKLLSSFMFGYERELATRLLAQRKLFARSYVRRDFAQTSGFSAEEKARAAQPAAYPRTLRDLHHAALTHPILPYYLESYDKVAAAYGLDHRHPYFDVRLMQFCLALPGEERLVRGWDRVVQRRAFEGLVPEPIRLRQTKSVWTPNFERSLLERPSERARELFESQASPLRPYCDLPALARDWQRMRAGGSRERLMELWCALSLGCWLQTLPG